MPRKRRAVRTLQWLVILVAAIVIVVATELPRALYYEPQAGWGQNNRAWGDDEYWMDLSLAAVQGFFTLLTVLGAVWLYNRERSDRRRDKLDDAFTEQAEGLRDLLGRMRSDVATLAEPVTWSVSADEDLSDRLNALDELRRNLPDYESRLAGFPGASQNVRMAYYQLDSFVEGVQLILDAPHDRRAYRALAVLYDEGRTLARALYAFQQAQSLGHQQAASAELGWPTAQTKLRHRIRPHLGPRRIDLSPPVSDGDASGAL